MKKIILTILLVGVLVISSACTAPTATATVAGPTQPVILQETSTPDAAEVEATATFPLIITATPGETTPTPVATPVETTAPMPTVVVAGGTAERLTFPNGGTAIHVNGNVAAQGKRSYLLNATKDQYMMVNLDSLSTALSLEITSGSGQTTLLPSASLAKAWKGTLTETQDYRIDVVSTSTTSDDYSLQVIVPQRIRFAPGGISATISGSVSENGVTTYLAGASKGQTMTVTSLPPPTPSS